MLVAFFAEVQGNAAALDAVLSAIARARPDHIVAAGDFVGLGPNPRRVLRLLGKRAVDLIRGPGDAILAFSPGSGPSRPGSAADAPASVASEPAADPLAWTRAARRMLDASELELLGVLPETRSLRAGDRELWFTHGGASELQALGAPSRAEPEVMAALQHAGLLAAEVVAFGSPEPFVRRVAGRLLVGAGSAGRPHGDPRACFVLIRLESGREPTAEVVRVAYSLARTERAMRKRTRSGVISEEQSLEFLGGLLRGGLARSGAAVVGGDSGVERLLALLGARAAAIYSGPELGGASWAEVTVDRVHELCGAVQRLREALVAAAPLAEDFHVARAEKRLRKLARALEQRRRVDLAIREVRAREEMSAGRTVASELLRALKSEQRAASKRLIRKHPARKLVRAGLELLGMIMDPVPSDMTLGQLTREHVKKRLARLEERIPALDHPKDQDAHEGLRVAATQLRVALELAREADAAAGARAATGARAGAGAGVAVDWDRLGGRAGALEDVLTKLEDARATAQLARELGTSRLDRLEELVRSLEHDAKARHRAARDLFREEARGLFDEAAAMGAG